jgi:histidinol-phosphate aminotransferase
MTIAQTESRIRATPIAPRPELAAIEAVLHGGFADTISGDVLDFSANVNPFGPSPRVWEALCAVALGRHPDPRAAPLRRFLAMLEAVDPARLLVGNGSIELIYNLAVAYLRPGDRVLVVEPTFGEYAAAARIMGAQVLRWRSRPEHGFALNLDALVRLALRTRPRLLFLCNPNNPTGSYQPREVIEYLLAALPETLIVLDEAFVLFIPDAWVSRDLVADNLLVLRSLTKDYALTGLRVGYARGARAVIAALEKVQPPWSVNAMAQAATIAALKDEAHLQRSLAALAEAKHALVHDMEAIGLAPLSSRVSFFLLHVGAAAIWRQRLLERGMLVRDCTSFGLPGYIRVAVRRPAENARLVAALAALKEQLCPAEL